MVSLLKHIQDLKKDKNNFVAKILNKSIKDVVEIHVEQFNQEVFEEIKFESDGKIKWKDNLIGQFYKGQELSKPGIKIFNDDHFEAYKKILK